MAQLKVYYGVSRMDLAKGDKALIEATIEVRDLDEALLILAKLPFVRRWSLK